MGQTLSSPATWKTSESGASSRFAYAVTEMQGWRITMEDAHAAVLALDEGTDQTNTFFAVYDGHGGGTVAKFAAQNVHKRLVKEEAYEKKNYEEALKRAFLGTDEDLLAGETIRATSPPTSLIPLPLSDPAHVRDPSGCTAVAALITADNKIYVANAGDSRSVISNKGVVEPLSFDHKPTNEGERARITAAGGYIEYGRVNGNLALSRAIGDFEFKKNYNVTPDKQVITANPDVKEYQLTDEDEFVVIACDGIWDCLTSQQVVDFVRFQVSEGKSLQEIGEMMCDHCLAPDTSSGAGIGCDNMTVLIVAILNGRTQEEWNAWITDRVKKGYGYQTPTTLPQLYAQSRIMSFRARREAQEARERSRQDGDDSAASFLVGSGLGPFARVLGSAGGISYSPATGILSDGGALMFGSDDSEEDDDSDEELRSSRSFFTDQLGIGRGDSPDPTESLKAKLDAFEQADDETDDDGDSHMVDALEEQETEEREEDIDGAAAAAQRASTPGPAPATESNPNVAEAKPGPTRGETPPPPPHLPNGDANAEPPKQFESQPGGDAASPAVKAEGLMDKSEDPMRV
ncbi:PP2C-domain-containing protein [Schizophyllum commune Tattone D]